MLGRSVVQFQFSTFTEHSAHILGDSSLVAYQLQWPTKPCGALSPIALDSFFVAFSFPDRHRSASSSSLIPCITYDRLGHKQTEGNRQPSIKFGSRATHSISAARQHFGNEQKAPLRPSEEEEAVIEGSIYVKALNAMRARDCDSGSD